MDITFVFHHLPVSRVYILILGFVLIVALREIGKRVAFLNDVFARHSAVRRGNYGWRWRGRFGASNRP